MSDDYDKRAREVLGAIVRVPPPGVSLGRVAKQIETLATALRAERAAALREAAKQTRNAIMDAFAEQCADCPGCGWGLPGPHDARCRVARHAKKSAADFRRRADAIERGEG